MCKLAGKNANVSASKESHVLTAKSFRIYRMIFLYIVVCCSIFFPCVCPSWSVLTLWESSTTTIEHMSMLVGLEPSIRAVLLLKSLATERYSMSEWISAGISWHEFRSWISIYWRIMSTSISFLRMVCSSCCLVQWSLADWNVLLTHCSHLPLSSQVRKYSIFWL